VLLKAWVHASRKWVRFGLQELIGTPSQYPVARMTMQVVCNQGLLGSHLYNSYNKKRVAAVQTVSARELILCCRTALSSASKITRIEPYERLAMRARHALSVRALEH